MNFIPLRIASGSYVFYHKKEKTISLFASLYSWKMLWFWTKDKDRFSFVVIRSYRRPWFFTRFRITVTCRSKFNICRPTFGEHDTPSNHLWVVFSRGRIWTLALQVITISFARSKLCSRDSTEVRLHVNGLSNSGRIISLRSWLMTLFR